MASQAAKLLEMAAGRGVIPVEACSRDKVGAASVAVAALVVQPLEEDEVPAAGVGDHGTWSLCQRPPAGNWTTG